MTSRTLVLSVTVVGSLAVAGCSAREESRSTIIATATEIATVAPGAVVPWADLPLPLHPVKPAPATLKPSVAAPPEVRAGEVLSYQLTLQNDGPNPYQPADCPVYVAWLQDATDGPVNIAGEPLTLNCAPAGAIPAGGQARFEMQYWVPESTPAGRWDLVWAFAAYSGPYGAEARATVQVVRR